MLNLDTDREPTPPKDAATLLVLRDARAEQDSAEGAVEVFCVRRHAKSAFMGGVVVFPGGKLDVADGEEASQHADGAHERAIRFADDERHALALAVRPCRESLEEAAIVPSSPAPDDSSAESLREALKTQPFAELLSHHGLTLATRELVPFARWVTPVAEARRYDARFFVTRLPEGQVGRHDDHETTSSVWATPSRLLKAFMDGDLFLAPPTVRALEILGAASNVDEAMALCGEQSLLPICPEVVMRDGKLVEPTTLALPGDPEHSVKERRVSGSTRFVLTDGKFVSGSA